MKVWCPRCGRLRYIYRKKGMAIDKPCARCAHRNRARRQWPISPPTACPRIGHIRLIEGVARRQILTWCPDCGYVRWTIFLRAPDPKHPERRRCRKCYGESTRAENHPTWKGGFFNKRGYMHRYIDRDSWLQPLTNRQSYLAEHRRVYAEHLKSLGYPESKIIEYMRLTDVHHIYGDKLDNRIEKLRGVPKSKHKTDYATAISEGMAFGILLLASLGLIKTGR